MIHQTMATVKSGRLYQMGEEGDSIVVGTPSWFDWLEEHASFLFVDHGSAVSVHKDSKDHGESEWKASRRRMGKVFTVSLGPSHAINLSKLRAATRRLTGRHTHNRSIALSVEKPSAARLPGPGSEPVTTTGSLRTLMRTKLYHPRSASDIIPRTRLIERMNEVLDYEIVLICAPAGFGKTTLVTQWVKTIEHSYTWLSLDENDNELSVFVQSLVASLQTAFPDAFEDTAALLKAPRLLAPDQIASLLINDLADLPGDVILILDDYHFIHNREIHTLIEQLVEHLPPQLHLSLICRSDPPLPIARWLAKGRLRELRGTDLRFTSEETETFLTGLVGSETAHETAVALNERTEGWIATLRLAAISLSNTTDRAVFLEHLDSYTARSMSSYLVGEILTQQTQEMQEFLERTSILDQFCAELCATVMGNVELCEHAQSNLDWLDRMNLFLIPLDKRNKWYRFHHLFQELMQQHLQTHSNQQDVATLHLRASQWYASHDLIEEAIDHALLAGDPAIATKLVEAHYMQAFEHERLTVVEHWLRLLPSEQIEGSADLLTAKAWIAQARGQILQVPGLLTAAEQLMASVERNASHAQEPNLRPLRGLIATLWSLYQFFSGQVQESLESARSALALLPPGEMHIASHAMQFLAWSYQATGHEDVALATVQQALQDQSIGISNTARILFAQIYVYLAAGKLPHAEHAAQYLLHITREDKLALSLNYAHWLLGLVYYEQNRLDEALYHFSAVIADQHNAHFWVLQDVLCGLALTYQARGSITRAQETANTQLELVQVQHNIPELMIAFAFHGRLALLQNDVEQASQWLEMAGEQEVRGPMFFLIDPAVTRVRLLLARGDMESIDEGQALLTQLLQLVESIHNTRKMILVLALQAWAYDLQGQETAALAMLERALTLARPGGFIRTFADLAPLATLLHQWRKHKKELHEIDKPMDLYVQNILAAMDHIPAQAHVKEDLLVKEGLEALTRRELQILNLLDSDLTNKEIARELVVTTETVKLHTKHVYRKLSVNNRRAAVSLGKALGLLPAS